MTPTTPTTQPVATAKSLSDAGMTAIAEMQKQIDNLTKETVTKERNGILAKLDEKGLKDKFKDRPLKELKSIMEGMDALPQAKQFGKGKASDSKEAGKIEVYNWNTQKYEFR